MTDDARSFAWAPLATIPVWLRASPALAHRSTSNAPCLSFNHPPSRHRKTHSHQHTPTHHHVELKLRDHQQWYQLLGERAGHRLSMSCTRDASRLRTHCLTSSHKGQPLRRQRLRTRCSQRQLVPLQVCGASAGTIDLLSSMCSPTSSFPPLTQALLIMTVTHLRAAPSHQPRTATKMGRTTTATRTTVLVSSLVIISLHERLYSISVRSRCALLPLLLSI